MTEGRSAPDAYGVDTGQETCARCGHTAPTCKRCGRDTPMLGAHINGLPLCHTFVEQQPSCYTLTDRYGRIEKLEDGSLEVSFGNELRWHYGPTETDRNPGSMWCYDCESEVLFVEEMYLCTGCGKGSVE